VKGDREERQQEKEPCVGPGRRGPENTEPVGRSQRSLCVCGRPRGKFFEKVPAGGRMASASSAVTRYTTGWSSQLPALPLSSIIICTTAV